MVDGKNTSNDSEEEKDSSFEANAGSSDISNDSIIPVSGMYKNYFLDYASYVILERAVPLQEDGLKPVQRRILHSMYELEDGRYNKVANVIGNTMKYHPHGDASIGDAMVQIGQKDLLIDMQGNWGNTFTGDYAAAPRYIEARLSKFALEVVYNPKTTNWQLSYDGRNKEPLALPVKFPLLLAQGAEGIAVGLACKILPHNFNELIDASIAFLKKQSFRLVPDFHTGGMADFTNYNSGLRGGKVRVRAKIEQLDKKTLIIKDIPFGCTTSSLIDSILKANDNGKIKIRKIEDNTAEFVEIVVHLQAGFSPDQMMDALYAFTDCEVSISPNLCVIENDTPIFIAVEEVLKKNTLQTVQLLTNELNIHKGEIEEQWHFASLERIFIEKRVYRDIEECETWEEIIQTIHTKLKPHTKKLVRAVTDEDVAKLTEIRIKRISKFDSNKANDLILNLEKELEEVKGNLSTITEYAINYFKNLKKKYGAGRERKTEIRVFDTIERSKVAVANVKLYVDKTEGFIGTGLKKTESEFVSDCSDIDDIIVIREDGKMIITKVSAKTFVGKGILHVAVWNKVDTRTTYNLIYRDGSGGSSMIKRFQVTGVTRDKEYDLTKGKKGSEVLYLSVNPNGEAETVSIQLKPIQKVKKLKFDADFSAIGIKGRGAAGNILSKYPIKKVEQKEKGLSTLGALKVWFDDTVQKLNTEERGELLGDFNPDDKIISIYQGGYYRITGFDATTHFDAELIALEKWKPNKPISSIYFDGEKKLFFVKRFLAEESDKKVFFISETEGSYLEMMSLDWIPMVELVFKGTKKEPETLNLAEFIAVKGLKAQGNRLSQSDVKMVKILEPLQPNLEDLIQMDESVASTEEPISPAEIPSDSSQGSIPIAKKPIVKKSTEDDGTQGQIAFDL
jgi:topoisomerase-4 subunit A